MENPFRKNTISYHDWEILKDLKWHCSKCELQSGQAKTWQTWRDEKGIQFEEPSPRRWKKRMLCSTCQKKTSHRKLKTLEQLESVSRRVQITQKIAKKVKNLYQNEEAVFLRKMSPRELEIDHKFPQIRWGKDEETNENLTDIQLKEKFILLNRNNNLLKSRYCEKCFETGERGSFPGIHFWFIGGKMWDRKYLESDKSGCVGCFWNNPYKWRLELNKILGKS